jgi:hypothetical protein
MAVYAGMFCRQRTTAEGNIVKECYVYVNVDVMMNFHDASAACSTYNGTLPPVYDDKQMTELVHRTLRTWPGE